MSKWGHRTHIPDAVLHGWKKHLGRRQLWSSFCICIFFHTCYFLCQQGSSRNRQRKGPICFLVDTNNVIYHIEEVSFQVDQWYIVCFFGFWTSSSKKITPFCFPRLWPTFIFSLHSDSLSLLKTFRLSIVIYNCHDYLKQKNPVLLASHL